MPHRRLQRGATAAGPRVGGNPELFVAVVDRWSSVCVVRIYVDVDSIAALLAGRVGHFPCISPVGAEPPVCCRIYTIEAIFCFLRGLFLVVGPLYVRVQTYVLYRIRYKHRDPLPRRIHPQEYRTRQNTKVPLRRIHQDFRLTNSSGNGRLQYTYFEYMHI